ncbi:MAG: hypothetical protein JXA57_19235 [Armatimonadetes bacterium]|nr:hypothetical protein [Armatimonadota bacterium]
MSRIIVEVIAIVAAAASWAGAVVALRQAHLAKRALVIAERQEARVAPKLSLYLFDGHVVRRRSERLRIFAFSVQINNLSDLDDTVARVELVVEYSRDRALHRVILSHDPTAAAMWSSAKASVLVLPTRISARGATTGWALFVAPDDLLGLDDTIQSYTLQVRDIADHVAHVEPVVLREIIGEEELEKG